MRFCWKFFSAQAAALGKRGKKIDRKKAALGKGHISGKIQKKLKKRSGDHLGDSRRAEASVLTIRKRRGKTQVEKGEGFSKKTLPKLGGGKKPNEKDFRIRRGCLSPAL